MTRHRGGGSSSSTELTQSSGQTEGTDTGASLDTTSATQPKATGEATGTTTTSNENAAPAVTADEEGTAAAAGEEGDGEAVAKVGETTYTTLEDAFAALNGTNRTLSLLNESAWDAATPVYYKVGETSGYVPKLTDALTAAYKANAGDITIVCRPGSNLGAMTHGHVADNITIYGNSAYISGGECDLEVDTYQFDRSTGKQTNDPVTELAGKTIAINAYDVDNLGVWGQRNTNATVNVNLTNCDGKNPGATNVQRVYVSGTSGVNNFTLTDCDFITANTAVYSNADGAVAISNCSFAGSIVPVNFNHKATGTQTVTVACSTFTNCGTTGDWAAFAAPARFVNSATGTLNVAINGCLFADTVGVNGDILIGDGRTGQESNDVTLTVTNTTAKVQAQKPGYYGTGTTVADESLKGEVATTPEKGLDSASINSIVTPTPAGIAEVNGKGYSSLQEAIAAAKDGEIVTLLADATEDVAISKSITLDLGGKTLTNTNKGKATISVRGGTVTVKNGNIAGGTNYYNIEVTKGSNANLTLTDVTATAGNNGSSMIDNWGTMTVTSGTYTGGLDVVKSEEGSKLTITGGTFTLTKGTSKGFTGVVFNYGELTISGGEFIQSDKSAPYGQAQVIHTDKSGSAVPSTVITGGTFKNLCTSYSQAWTVRATNAAAGATKVSGGTFNKKVFDSYLADGLSCVKNADGTYGAAVAIAQIGSVNYASLQDAINAAKSRSTVKLLTDIVLDAQAGSESTLYPQFTISGKKLTLDMQGHKISYSEESRAKDYGKASLLTLSIENGSNVTITGNGTIDTELGSNQAYGINILGGSNLAIDNGTFYGAMTAVQVQKGGLVINDGTFLMSPTCKEKVPQYAKYIINCIDSAWKDGSASVSIKGGTFGHDYSHSPEGEGTSYLAPGYAPVDNGDGTYGVVAGVALIDTKAYATLADAVAAAQDGDTITLLSDCSGNGIKVEDDTFPNGLTIDFAGYSYTVGGKFVGSTGTASNGFQLLKGNTIVMRNGSIYGDAGVAGDDTTDWSGAPAIMIQNYSNLTLDGMTVKGGKETCYTLSNNNGDTVVKDSTIVAGQNTKAGGPFAFDVCRYASYPSVSVTVEGNSVINGCVDVSGAIGAGQSRQLTITDGKFDKAISVSTQPANIAISGGTFATEVPAEYCAGGFTPVANGDGTYGVKLDEGAYLLQEFRSGDQDSWTYPTPEGMAFAGWYKDALFTTPCAASDVEGAAYAKFVKITNLLQYKGGSLRMDVGDPAELTYLRFGYTMAIPAGSTFVENGWYYKKVTEVSPDEVRFVAYNNAMNNDGTVTANLVFNKVKTDLYTSDFTEKAFVKYVTADGTTVEAVEGKYQTYSVSDVADAILEHPMASKAEKEYAQKIKSAIQLKVG